MQEKLSRDEVLHAAGLAKISLNEEEIEKYRIELKKILDEIEKINDVENYNTDRLIAPWEEHARLREDNESNHLEAKETLKNAPRHLGNYIEVPIVVAESEGA